MDFFACFSASCTAIPNGIGPIDRLDTSFEMLGVFLLNKG